MFVFNISDVYNVIKSNICAVYNVIVDTIVLLMLRLLD